MIDVKWPWYALEVKCKNTKTFEIIPMSQIKSDIFNNSNPRSFVHCVRLSSNVFWCVILHNCCYDTDISFDSFYSPYLNNELRVIFIPTTIHSIRFEMA